MNTYKQLKDLEYNLPCGGMGCNSNVSIIINTILQLYPGINFEFDTLEFSGFMSMFGNEILLSMMLDKRGLSMNEILKEGFDFRGIKIRII